MKKMQIIIFIVALICFIYSGTKIGTYYWARHVSAKNMEKTKELLVVPEATGDSVKESESEESDEDYLKRYSELKAKNPDAAGWIRIPDTTIDYPVMYVAGDNDKYLHSNFYGEYDAGGVPFIDGACTLDPISSNLILYGHHMNDKSMFEPIINYKSQDFYNTHQTILFDLINERGTYEVTAVLLTKALYSNEVGFDFYRCVDFADEAAFNDFLANIQPLELYDTGKQMQYGDRLISLSTCEYSQENGRMVIIARKVPNK